MNVNSYPVIIDGWSVGRLEREIKMFYPLLGNHWVGRYDEPENTIEKYIQDCYSMYYEEKYPTAQGFEWWFHVFTTEDRGIGFHSDHDETHRQREGTMKYPLRSTITYIRDPNLSPTIILNSQTGKYPNEVKMFPPTEIVVSNPDDGKLLDFDSRYLHAVFPPNKGRMTLMFNIWDYRPSNLPRHGTQTTIYDLRFYKELAEQPVPYLGPKYDTTCDVADKRITITGSDDKTDGSTWLVHQ
mgnify:FL=1